MWVYTKNTPWCVYNLLFYWFQKYSVVSLFIWLKLINTQIFLFRKFYNRCSWVEFDVTYFSRHTYHVFTIIHLPVFTLQVIILNVCLQKFSKLALNWLFKRRVWRLIVFGDWQFKNASDTLPRFIQLDFFGACCPLCKKRKPHNSWLRCIATHCGMHKEKD